MVMFVLNNVQIRYPYQGAYAQTFLFQEVAMAMDNRNLQRIKVLLQDTEVQVRVRENIRKGGEEAKVTIGRAAELFDIKPSKLR